MKTFATLLLIVFAANRALSQQPLAIIFANNATSTVYNAYTGALVKNTDKIHVMLLYYAPSGTTDEAAFIAFPPSTMVAVGGAVTSGRFNGGTRTFSNNVGQATLSFQVRAFETN